MWKQLMKVKFFLVDDAWDPSFVETYALSDILWDGAHQGEIAFR